MSSSHERLTLLKELDEAGSTGLDMSLGDPLARRAAAFIRSQSLSQESVRSAEGEGEACYYCHLPIHSVDSMRGGPVGLCHADEPGMVKWHHTACVSERLADQESVRSEALQSIIDELAAIANACVDLHQNRNRPDSDAVMAWDSAKLTLGTLRKARALQSPARVAEGERSDHDVVGEHLRSSPESPAKEQPE